MTAGSSTLRGSTAPAAIGDPTLRHLAAEGWDELLYARPAPDPCRSIDWLDAWAASERAGAPPVAHTIRRGGELAAAMALEVRRRNGVTLIKDYAAAGPWFDLEPPARDPDCLMELLEGLRRQRGDVLVLDGIVSGSSYHAAVQAAFPYGTFVPITDGYCVGIESPTRRLTKRRADVRRGMRRAAERGRPLDRTMLHEWTAIAPHIDEVLDFHATHLAASGVNHFAGPGMYRRFTRQALARMGAREALRLTTVRQGGTLVALDVIIVAGRHAVALTRAFDRTVDVASLGWSATVASLDFLAHEGVGTLDLGPGEKDSYKRFIVEGVDRVKVVVPLSLRGRAAVGARRVLGGRLG